MPNFKNYFFATFKISQELNRDFSIFNKVPCGELAVTVYIPGEKQYCQFTISTNIGLYGYNRDNSAKEVIYKPTKIKADTYSRVFNEYRKSDEVFFAKMLEDSLDLNEHTKFSFLVKESIYDISLADFISLVEDTFLQKVKSTLSDDFQVYRENHPSSHTSFNKKILLTTQVDINSINESLQSFKTEFKKARMLCNYPKNRKFLKVFIPAALITFNEILASHSLPNLKKQLETELSSQNLKSNKVKI